MCVLKRYKYIYIIYIYIHIHTYIHCAHHNSSVRLVFCARSWIDVWWGPWRRQCFPIKIRCRIRAEDFAWRLCHSAGVSWRCTWQKEVGMNTSCSVGAHYPLNLSAAWTQICMLFSSCVFLDVSLGLRVSCFLKCRSTGALGFLTCQVRHDRRSKSATSRRARVWPRFHWDTFWERFKALGLGHWIRCLQIPVLLHCFLAFCWRHSTDKKESWLQPGLLSWQDKAKLSRNSTSNDWLVIVFSSNLPLINTDQCAESFRLLAAMENFVQKRLRTYCSQHFSARLKSWKSFFSLGLQWAMLWVFAWGKLGSGHEKVLCLQWSGPAEKSFPPQG